jgi:hypothetical protein
MIRMKALKTFGFAGANEGPVKRGREFIARDAKRADELEAHGLAYRVQEKATAPAGNGMEPPVKNQSLPGAHKNKAAEQGPLDLAGGSTGGEGPAPSSRQARAPRVRQSRPSEGDSRS